MNHHVMKQLGLAVFLVGISASSYAQILKCSGPGNAIIYTDTACPKGMRSESIELENKKNAITENAEMTQPNSRKYGNQNFMDEEKSPGAQLSADMATIKRARLTSLEMDGKSADGTPLASGKSDNASRLLSSRKWAYFIRNSEKAQYVRGQN